MPRMYCMGTSVEIPENGKICPKLPTNMVPNGQKCDITCESGTPSVSFIKCEADGWSNKDVQCNGTPTGLIVGLLVGGFIGVCIIAYIYARMKMRKKNKENKKQQPVSRAAKIAARNDLVVTGVVTKEVVKAGLVHAPKPKAQGKLVTGGPQETEYRHPSSSSRHSSQNISNPPSYHSLEHNDERNFETNSTRSGKHSRRSRNSNNEYSQPGQRKHRSYYDEYTEEVDLGFHDGQSGMVMDGQYHTAQDNGPMYPDYYGQPSGNNRRHHNAYGAMDQNYYNRQDQGGYPDQYLTSGVDNMGYSHHGGGYQKPYHVPI